ncbi:zf-DHHC-domain-containing protein [Athelia psychrophila]|uniref:Palmitoyltransferase PFA4 n=1 Tax=Athelia psychrophila TaxID=1759441 RepID=A0A166NR47_9AGAM|nr:zf-DHHC-domain-containing protein [Fibularhizoctonia sp. CBS 109695]
MGRLLGRIFVFCVVCLISFIAFSIQIFVIWPWYGSTLSVELLMLLGPFNFLIGMLFWNYFLCATVDPGRVPDSWRPDTNSGDGYEVKKLTGNPRYCRSCERHKPQRTHHCKQCNRCVLRMDHHCPWVNNCIGHFNYGHFIRFLCYVDASCIFHLTMLTRRVFAHFDGQYWVEPDTLELVFMILNYTLCIPVLLAVGGFSLYHLYSLLGNSTTIEHWEKDKVTTLVKRGKIHEVKFPYHLGARRNVESILGPNPLWWCWPTVTPGTGLKYQLADSDDIDLPAEWPPMDPTLQRPEDREAEDKSIVLPDSPWTYSDGLNPDLRATSAAKRQVRKAKAEGPISSLPPYHPDYQEDDADDYGASSSGSVASSADYYDEPGPVIHTPVRRGSEGYEVGNIDREAMLTRYIAEQVGEEGRYNLYVPEPDVDSESDGLEEGDDEDVPLANRVQNWRTETETVET